MALNVERQVSIRTAADAFFTKLHFRNTNDVVVYSSMDHTQDGVRTLLASGSVAMDLGGISALTFVYIEATLALEVILDGETVTIAPIDTGGTAVFFAEGSWTSLTITNPSSTQSLEVLWLLAGT
jgi:hypothetical protein